MRTKEESTYPHFNHIRLPREEKDAYRLHINHHLISQPNNVYIENSKIILLLPLLENVNLPPKPPNYDSLHEIDLVDINIINRDDDTFIQIEVI